MTDPTATKSEMTVRPTPDILIEPVCVYCNKAPWAKHRARCEPCVQKAIRAAVEAQKERCAKVDPIDHRCQWCEAKSGHQCIRANGLSLTNTPHEARWRAAIRAQK